MRDKASVLIYSCDSYADIWGPFFTLFFRYWKSPYPVYVTAESEQCMHPEVMTINTDGDSWTERIRAAVEQIPTEYVIGMCEDMFFRRGVRQGIIDKCIAWMDEDESIACFNFEKEYDWILPSRYPHFGRKPSGMHYQYSCQPTLWRRSILEKLLDCKMSAWEWEMSSASAPDECEFLIWNGPASDLVFEYGYHDNQWCGIQKGKWVLRDVGPLFEKEGIRVDFTQRGYV